jgi:hypothetical protein
MVRVDYKTWSSDPVFLLFHPAKLPPACRSSRVPKLSPGSRTAAPEFYYIKAASSHFGSIFDHNFLPLLASMDFTFFPEFSFIF